MASSGGSAVGGAGDGALDTVTSTGSLSSSIPASTASFEYGGDSVVANTRRVPPMTAMTSATVRAAYLDDSVRAATAGAR